MFRRDADLASEKIGNRFFTEIQIEFRRCNVLWQRREEIADMILNPCFNLALQCGRCKLATDNGRDIMRSDLCVERGGPRVRVHNLHQRRAMAHPCTAD